MSVRPIPCPELCLRHAEREQCGQILQSSLPHKKRHILASRTCSAANMAAPTDNYRHKRANNQGGNVHISNSTTPIVLILVSGDS